MIPILDDTHTLTVDEKDALAKHVLLDCYSTPVDRQWLKLIAVRDDGAKSYSGYWKAKALVDPTTKVVLDVNAIIVLNRYYLHDLDDLKETLSHEYGHHVTLSYLMVSRNHADGMTQIKAERAPIDYYRARNIENAYNAISPFYTNGWDKCDKEIMAEDYRVCFTTSKSPHRMAASHGPPPVMVRDWIWHLFHPHHVGESWPF